MNLKYPTNIQAFPRKPIVFPAWKRQDLLRASPHGRAQLAEKILAFAFWLGNSPGLSQRAKHRSKPRQQRRSLYNRVSQTRDHNMSASWLARDAVHSRINMLGHTAEHLAVRLSFPAKAGIIFAGKKNHRSVTEFIISEKLWLISGCSVNHFTAETCRPSVPQQSKKWEFYLAYK